MTLVLGIILVVLVMLTILLWRWYESQRALWEMELKYLTRHHEVGSIPVSRQRKTIDLAPVFGKVRQLRNYSKTVENTDSHLQSKDILSSYEPIYAKSARKNDDFSDLPIFASVMDEEEIVEEQYIDEEAYNQEAIYDDYADVVDNKEEIEFHCNKPSPDLDIITADEILSRIRPRVVKKTTVKKEVKPQPLRVIEEDEIYRKTTRLDDNPYGVKRTLSGSLKGARDNVRIKPQQPLKTISTEDILNSLSTHQLASRQPRNTQQSTIKKTKVLQASDVLANLKHSYDEQEKIRHAYANRYNEYHRQSVPEETYWNDENDDLYHGKSIPIENVRNSVSRHFEAYNDRKINAVNLDRTTNKTSFANKTSSGFSLHIPSADESSSANIHKQPETRNSVSTNPWLAAQKKAEQQNAMAFEMLGLDDGLDAAYSLEEQDVLDDFITQPENKQLETETKSDWKSSFKERRKREMQQQAESASQQNDALTMWGGFRNHARDRINQENNEAEKKTPLNIISAKKDNTLNYSKFTDSKLDPYDFYEENHLDELVPFEIPLPNLSLLNPPEFDFSVKQSEEELLEKSITIEEKLAEFKVKVKVMEAYAGPVITRYEIEPDVGVRGNQVINLEKDLARALGCASIRIVETIPGKTCMGLELPNPKRQTIRLSEILGTDIFSHAKSKLTLALGQDIIGNPVVTNLAKAPHLLVAGTTGSGKSVGVNAMILSLLFKATPDEVRLIMIDPKMLELSIYEGIPHLLAPVVTDMKLAANALTWCVNEMEKRYRLMSHLGVRNLEGYNQRIVEESKRGKKIANPFSLTPDNPEPLEKLPFIVVVVDEFADLMMTVGKKIEELIARLAQKARAAGIHLILATQRPSVDVITGLIKANIPTRIAFQVSSKVDSRTILDQMGAENLLGQGDMLFLPPGSGYPQRIHGAFVADEEVHRVVEYLKQYGEPNYIDDILTAGVGPDDLFSNAAGGSSNDGESDPLYDEAVAFVIKTQKASISSVQRQLRIGYNRAARLIEQMEEAGVVSSPENNGSRTVLVKHSVE